MAVGSAKQYGEPEVGATGAGGKEVDGVDAVLAGGAEDAHHDRRGPPAPIGAVAAPYLSVHHHRADALFCPPVRSSRRIHLARRVTLDESV